MTLRSFKAIWMFFYHHKYSRYRTKLISYNIFHPTPKTCFFSSDTVILSDLSWNHKQITSSTRLGPQLTLFDITWNGHDQLVQLSHLHQHIPIESSFNCFAYFTANTTLLLVWGQLPTLFLAGSKKISFFSHAFLLKIWGNKMAKDWVSSPQYS